MDVCILRKCFASAPKEQERSLRLNIKKRTFESRIQCNAVLWWWLLSFEPRIRQRERTSFFPRAYSAFWILFHSIERVFFFILFIRISSLIISFKFDGSSSITRVLYGAFCSVFWLWLLIHSLVQYFIALYNTQHAYKLWKGDSYCIFFLFISSSRRHRRRLRYLFVHDFIRIICVYMLFFRLVFFFLFLFCSLYYSDYFLSVPIRVCWDRYVI